MAEGQALPKGQSPHERAGFAPHIAKIAKKREKERVLLDSVVGYAEEKISVIGNGVN